MRNKPTVTPALRYADAPAAVKFLSAAFGFETRLIFADPQNPSIIQHAQLTLGNGMVMLSSAVSGEAATRYRWKTPTEAGGITACICVVVDDVDAHYAQAVAAGAEIVTMPHDNPGYPGRSYNARDLEGNNWDFGTYDPWRE
jgi:uncharacterized glyoxalase superfamily protein PhnB